MLKNWVTETREYKWVNSIMTAFQLYVKELSNWNIKVHSPRLKPLTFQLYVKELSNWNTVPGAAWFHSVACFNYMLKNWVTETSIAYGDMHLSMMFQLYVKELSNWNFQNLPCFLQIFISFNYMLKNWVTETLVAPTITASCSTRFQLYVKELSNWNRTNGAAPLGVNL